MIFSGALSEGQMEGCIELSISLMEKPEFHDKAKTIVEEIVCYPIHPERAFSSLFYGSRLFFPQDTDLVKKLISLNPNELFLDFRCLVSKNDISIINLADVILHLCEQFLDERNIILMQKGRYYAIVNELPALIATLYDQADGDEPLRSKCLSMWDALYQSDVSNARALTQQIMDC